ncbi:MAG: hypothetical protein ACK56E_02770, partial [Planctomyces sp.]
RGDQGLLLSDEADRSTAGTMLLPLECRRSRGHSIFITDLLIRNPEQQARFFAATFTRVSVSANQE